MRISQLRASEVLTSFFWSMIGPEKLHIYSVAFCLPNFLPNTHKIGAFWVILKLFLNFKIPHWDRNSQQNRNFRKFHIIFNQTFLFRGYGEPAFVLQRYLTSTGIPCLTRFLWQPKNRVRQNRAMQVKV